MTEWTDVEHREECQIRPAEKGEVVSTLAGPAYPHEGDFVLRRRVVPFAIVDAELDELRQMYLTRYGTNAPDDTEHDDFYTPLGFGWDERVIDSDYAEYHFRMEDLEFEEYDQEASDAEVAEPLTPPYDQYYANDLNLEVQRRNATRESDFVEPASRRKDDVIAALEADDARSSD